MSMDISLDIREQISDIVKRVSSDLEGFGEAFEPDVRLADPRHGDFQVNGVLPWAKLHKTNPRELGIKLLERLNEFGSSDCPWQSIEIAGPGFLNFTIRKDYLKSWLISYLDTAMIADAAKHTLSGKRILVDFSSPNTAKQMHVGHIRSTVIGDSICRILEFCGAEVIRDNHIGDWGTQFGILIMVIKRKGVDLELLQGDRIEQLEELYREGSELAKNDPTALDEARQELVLLQKEDERNFKIWERIVQISYDEFQKIYDRLDVKFDVVLGESFYRDKVERVYRELREDGIAVESDGAWVVFHPEHSRFATQPFIIRKSDGASNYATTDLATALHRSEEFKAGEIINITDSRQKDHFEQLELTVNKWFSKRGLPLPCMRHVTFGTILGKDGKAIKTRSGKSVKLRELLDEAVDRAREITIQKNPSLNSEELENAAVTIGLAAVRYADLSQNRSSDYQFDWDKMLAFEGNTAPYLLYVVARINGIFRKLGDVSKMGVENFAELETIEELELAKKLTQFPIVLKQTLDDLRPHSICGYLYELCGSFNSFYHANTVINENLPIQNKRLLLCKVTLQLLKTGLNLVGIQTLEKM
jgi:arginyl-tRNA synthetase